MEESFARSFAARRIHREFERFRRRAPIRDRCRAASAFGAVLLDPVLLDFTGPLRVERLAREQIAALVPELDLQIEVVTEFRHSIERDQREPLMLVQRTGRASRPRSPRLTATALGTSGVPQTQ